MNSADDVLQLFQKSFRVTVGATSALLESIQDTQKREENMSKLQTDWAQFAEELADKGATTEQEARKFVDTLLAQASGGSVTDVTIDATTVTVTDPVPSTGFSGPEPALNSELRELIAQVAAMREELANLRSSG